MLINWRDVHVLRRFLTVTNFSNKISWTELCSLTGNYYAGKTAQKFCLKRNITFPRQNKLCRSARALLGSFPDRLVSIVKNAVHSRAAWYPSSIFKNTGFSRLDPSFDHVTSPKPDVNKAHRNFNFQCKKQEKN